MSVDQMFISQYATQLNVLSANRLSTNSHLTKRRETVIFSGKKKIQLDTFKMNNLSFELPTDMK
jgi:hypothetical protein